MVVATIHSAELYASKKHHGQLKKDGVTLVTDHLKDVVLKVKDLGITDQNVLCVAWLHDVLENTDATVDEIGKKFGKNILTLLLPLTKDKTSPKAVQDEKYVEQLKKAPIEIKLVKLCDIASNLEKIHRSEMPASAKIKTIKRPQKYLSAIQKDILLHDSSCTPIIKLVDEINTTLKTYNLNKV